MLYPYQIAVVGVATLFPGSEDRHGFWKDILAGRDLITEIPFTHWSIADYYDPDPKSPDKIYAKRGAFLSEVAFDPLKNGMPPKIMPVTDTSQILGLVVAHAVLDDALKG
ncbi:MAG: beta-ketoacyl synthase N-terminal-like domain-containing protein [Acetobacteraceae bacterium]